MIQRLSRLWKETEHKETKSHHSNPERHVRCQWLQRCHGSILTWGGCGWICAKACSGRPCNTVKGLDIIPRFKGGVSDEDVPPLLVLEAEMRQNRNMRLVSKRLVHAIDYISLQNCSYLHYCSPPNFGNFKKNFPFFIYCSHYRTTPNFHNFWLFCFV